MYFAGRGGGLKVGILHAEEELEKDVTAGWATFQALG